jgi:tRNA G10  N-methylase Trm11
MDSSILILGRQPAIGLAELECLYGADNVRPIGDHAARVNAAPDAIAFDRLGGTVKLARILFVIDTVQWREIQSALEKSVAAYLADVPEGKLQLGISAYGLRVSPSQIMAAGLSLKKVLRKGGRSVRLIPNKEQALNSAQVLHNHLTGETGCELVLVRDGSKVICARTISEQDINAYTLRDHGRPNRDARVGMLPPKLAQIIVNLAATDRPLGETTVLDPFCGTGVVLQEAALMGYDIYGTDIEPRMITYSKANLEWLQVTHKAPNLDTVPLEAGDATSHTWEQPFDVVASETYLGQPFNTFPSSDKLAQVRGTCNTIIEKFLENISEQIQSGARLCLAIPAWQQKPGRYEHLPLLDHLGKLGYNRVDLKHAHGEDLIYSREDQIVGRELLIITRK